jgi:Ser/Thr protein kinase RdoA (MazF antagonist)
VLWTDDGPQFIDLDDARMGPAVQDLWMLFHGSREDMTCQLGWLVRGYREFFDFEARELGLVEPLRTLRMIHYAGWLARRWDDPAFPAAFRRFNIHAIGRSTCSTCGSRRHAWRNRPFPWPSDCLAPR